MENESFIVPLMPWREGLHSHQGFYPSKCHGGALSKESPAVPTVGKGNFFSLFFFAIHGETAFAAIQQLFKEGLSFLPVGLPGQDAEVPFSSTDKRQILHRNLSSKFQLVPQSIIYLWNTHVHLMEHQNGTENFYWSSRTKGFQGCQNFQ